VPKNPTGYTPSRSTSSPLSKQDTPMKLPTLPGTIKSSNGVASLPKVPATVKVGSNPGFKPGGISKPAKLPKPAPRI
jgi:hypothetical protein